MSDAHAIKLVERAGEGAFAMDLHETGAQSRIERTVVKTAEAAAAR